MMFRILWLMIYLFNFIHTTDVNEIKDTEQIWNINSISLNSDSTGLEIISIDERTNDSVALVVQDPTIHIQTTSHMIIDQQINSQYFDQTRNQTLEFEMEIKDESNYFPPPELASHELIPEIRYYVAYAGATYCEPNFIGFTFCSYCSRFGNQTTYKYVKDDITETRVLIAVNPDRKEVVVGFRGSEGFTKFMAAASNKTIDYPGVPGAEVHYNAYEFIQSVKGTIIDELKPHFIQFPQFRLVIVGHSFGGSLATLLAPELHHDLPIPYSQLRVITYNQPRVGNINFSRWYHQLHLNFTRVVNESDEITNYPQYHFGWRHVHHELHINNDQYYHCPSSSSSNTDHQLEHPDCSFQRTTIWGLLTHHKSVGNMTLSELGCLYSSTG